MNLKRSLILLSLLFVRVPSLDRPMTSSCHETPCPGTCASTPLWPDRLVHGTGMNTYHHHSLTQAERCTPYGYHPNISCFCCSCLLYRLLSRRTSLLCLSKFSQLAIGSILQGIPVHYPK